jgi:hypothetical protein
MWFNQGRTDGNCFEEESQEFVVVCVGIDMPISLIDPFSLLHLVKYRVTQPDLNHLDIIFMFFPKCAPNGIFGVEGTLSYVAQNCQ